MANASSGGYRRLAKDSAILLPSIKHGASRRRLTYLTDVADTSPILIIDAPEKACAKTLLQTVVGRMSYRPLPASNASLSALFRAVELWKPTILIDEADTFFRDRTELHGMINAG